MFQSLIGNVQLQKKLVNTLKILLFQSLIGNVQPQHFRHFYFPLSPNPPFFASFFQKSRSVSFSKSSIFLDFTAFSRFHKSPLETDRLFILFQTFQTLVNFYFPLPSGKENPDIFFFLSTEMFHTMH